MSAFLNLMATLAKKQLCIWKNKGRTWNRICNIYLFHKGFVYKLKVYLDVLVSSVNLYLVVMFIVSTPPSYWRGVETFWELAEMLGVGIFQKLGRGWACRWGWWFFLGGGWHISGSNPIFVEVNYKIILMFNIFS